MDSKSVMTPTCSRNNSATQELMLLGAGATLPAPFQRTGAGHLQEQSALGGQHGTLAPEAGKPGPDRTCWPSHAGPHLCVGGPAP